ncbi:MAG TPA: lysophospholipid acyltransferase family protein [Accumulibacter sp.]|nr:lysophospholipid acyltransferase family protein [Accumulibacter sp.]HMW18100.1 lysophospholipid acyltransferase family protein [Accumulibacter sp.]HMX22609.1 lysophospholipid acyltransferase family protein [Accumulibacter sp.]HMY07033.1 lysophospholipid acyltransferase family protein [Accumulibacter sp.]HNC17196.1 lysophospholipid acyltransferase family protein [Accumulibacter sp.]
MIKADHAGWLWSAYETLAMGLGLGVFALACLIWLPLALPAYRLLPRRRGQWLGRSVARFAFHGYLGFLGRVCGCRFDLAELDGLRDDGPLILVANHPSLLDAVLILSRVPNTVCVMKAALMDNLLLGAAARLARFIRNDHPLSMFIEAGEQLAEGTKLLIFAEGTRTRNFPLERCQPTTGLLARRSKVAVQTLLIEFSTPYLGKNWPLFKRPALPLLCRVRLGCRFDPPENAAAFTAELEQYFRGELAGTTSEKASDSIFTPQWQNSANVG